MEAERLLVIILASALALLLLVAILALLKILFIINRLKRLADKAEQLTDKAGAVATVFKKAAGPYLAGKTLSGLAKVVGAKKKKR